MLKQAEGVVDEIMALATNLGGSISGELGIGITKFQYLPQIQKDEFATYKNKVDPKGLFNKNKLLEGADLSLAYTPSLQLVEQEALIMENSQIGEINHMVKDCLRCGKCKPVCTTHVPEANLLYSPRDKIIGTNLLIEAFLYEEQTRRGISLQHMAELEDISDHCTICHKCEKPCPVNIDYGEVSIKMREFLISKGHKHTSLATKFSFNFLNATSPVKIKILKKFLDISYLGQRLGAKLTHHKTKIPNQTLGQPSFPVRVETLLNRPLPKDTKIDTMRSLLKIESSTHIPILAHPQKSNEDSEAIFYFPGCGSERLFSQISLSALALLYDRGIKIILPPSYLCCGYPQNANGDSEKAMQISTQNRVLFHRIANTLNYLEIKTVLTSCGTCIDQLLTYQFGDIFQDSRLIDIHEYLLEKQVKLNNTKGKYLYHAPCHDPIKSVQGGEAIINELMGNEMINNDRCCSESGTFAVSRPDIAKQVSFRKEAEIHKDLNTLINKDVATKADNVQILTTCPACRQGLSRYEDRTGVSSVYPIEILAKEKLGKNWLKEFVKNVKVEEVLL
jgi:Fe-S oxidoreductase